MRLALIAAVALSLPTLFAATAADAHGCGRHAMREGGAFRDGSMGRFAFNRALLGGSIDCLDKERIGERRARRAAHGGYYEVHGRYQH